MGLREKIKSSTVHGLQRAGIAPSGQDAMRARAVLHSAKETGQDVAEAGRVVGHGVSVAARKINSARQSVERVTSGRSQEEQLAYRGSIKSERLRIAEARGRMTARAQMHVQVVQRPPKVKGRKAVRYQPANRGLGGMGNIGNLSDFLRMTPPRTPAAKAKAPKPQPRKNAWDDRTPFF
jgi:hypothetical protein